MATSRSEAAPTWADLVRLLDVPETLVYDEQVGYAREWRADNLAQLAAIRVKNVGAGSSASYLALERACREEIRLCEAFLADRDEPFEDVGGVSGGY